VAVVLLVAHLHDHSQYTSRKSRTMPLLQTMAEKLQIPPDIVLQLLPNENITILNFLDFPLPLTAAPSSEIFTSKQFLSNHLPDVTSLDIIRSTPTPSEVIIRGLVSAIKVASDAVESITCPHVASASPKHFPVWLAAYWFELLLVRQIRKCWSSAEKGLQKIAGLRKDLADSIPIYWSGSLRYRSSRAYPIDRPDISDCYGTSHTYPT
jgi:hypothetical protein